MSLKRRKEAPIEGLGRKTISDFGEQWRNFPGNKGFYASVALLQDYFGPLLTLEDLKNRRVAEIGSGTGRIIEMILRTGATHVTGVEPSAAFDNLSSTFQDMREKVALIHGPAEALPPTGDMDYVFSLGVIHHIPEPEIALRAAYGALRPGGRLLIWVYAREGNRLYLSLALPLRLLTIHLPHSSLETLSRLFAGLARLYARFCKYGPLPLKKYFLEVYSQLSLEQQTLIIYDQLNPSYAHYYTRSEVQHLLRRAGFANIRLFHRHGYSWTAVGDKH